MTSGGAAVVSWEFLLIGSFAALGAALALGTLAALLRYHRTGTFPGDTAPVELSRGRLVSLWMRVAVGVVILVAGIASLAVRGLLTL